MVDRLDRPLAYQRFEPPPQTLTLEVDDDVVRLTEPAQWVWLRRIGLLFWVMFAIAQALI